MITSNIYNLAVECKKSLCNEVDFASRNINLSSKLGSRKNNKCFENDLPKLCDLIKDKFPSICSILKKHINDYDKNTNFHVGAIDAILDCLIESSKSNANSKKIFISHSSKDSTIINAFIDNILRSGCGFNNDDIFCTLDTASIRTGDDFRNEIISNMKNCDYIFCFISPNYKTSEMCNYEVGAAWSMENKRILPLKFPNILFNDIGLLNETKQVANITDKSKLDELYKELCECYSLKQDWRNYNRLTESFIKTVNENLSHK